MNKLIGRLQNELDIANKCDCQAVIFELRKEEIEEIIKSLKLASVADEIAEALNGIDGILQWMANKEADYSADELRSMAIKAITFQGQTIAKFKEIKDE